MVRLLTYEQWTLLSAPEIIECVSRMGSRKQKPTGQGQGYCLSQLPGAGP